MRSKNQALWEVNVPGHMFRSLLGRWVSTMAASDWAEEQSRRSPKHTSWSSNWIDAKTKRLALRMAAHSPSGYATIRRLKRTGKQWSWVSYHITNPGGDEAQHPGWLWSQRAGERAPMSPQERMKRRK